jgi:hypothetical protein
MAKDVDLIDIDWLKQEGFIEQWIVQARQFIELDDLNEWLRKNSSIVSVIDIKYQASNDWDVYLVIFEIRERDLEKLEG